MGKIYQYGSGYAIYDKSGKRITKKIPTLREAKWVNTHLILGERLKKRKIKSKKKSILLQRKE